MIRLIRQYAHWLHIRWPAGTVEKLPEVNADGSTRVPGLFVVGDLTGVPLLKLAADSGARAVRTILADRTFRSRRREPGEDANGAVLDLVIVGAGVSGMAAVLEARKADLAVEILEASEPFSTIVNFPKGKPIYTYPAGMTPTGDLQFTATVKEPLVAQMRRQTLDKGIRPRIATVERVARKGRLLEVVIDGGAPLLAQRVIVAIGRSGNFRSLGVPGETLDKVYNRLHDPKDFCDQDVLVVGGGDSAVETAIAIAECGGKVTLSYRRPELTRPKPENVERLNRLVSRPSAEVDGEAPPPTHAPAGTGGLAEAHGKPVAMRLLTGSALKEIHAADVVVTMADGRTETIRNDTVFSMIGREPPLDFFRRSGVSIRGEWQRRTWLGFGLFAAFCVFLYHWKKDLGLPVYAWFKTHGWFPFNVGAWLDAAGPAIADAANTPGHILHVLEASMSQPGFYYTLAYCVIVVAFGIRRIRRRKTPYVTRQTVTLMAIQCLPLFILPEILLPWAGQNGWFDGGLLGYVGDQLFPNASYWRAYGLVIAWPLFIYNVFTDQPLWGWLVIGTVQTFVVIPLMVHRWGKGAYCGWICPCGALAETLGDAHRHKMPHGPLWNRLNMVGQVILWIALAMLLLRILGWIRPASIYTRLFEALLHGIPLLNYEWLVDLFLAGIVGVACYFWFSGRVWCRFACPLAALMHIYARFSRFRIFAEKKKCISCNVCTSVCHQGIDVMGFANRGLDMQDPQCVRCSACVQQCPTGVLRFGRLGAGGAVIEDGLSAMPAHLAEQHGQGHALRQP